MKILDYLKKNGLKRAFQVIYQYKINIVYTKIFSVVYKKAPLKEIIMIESHNDFDCNGGAFYEYLLQNGYNKKYRIVWILKHDNHPELPENVTWVPLLKPSLRKAYYCCRAKWFLSDCTVTNKVREDQVSIYLTHGGVSLKKVKGLMDLPASVDYVLSPSVNYDHVLRTELAMQPEQQLLHFGYPCLDILYRDTEDELKKITDKSYHKVIVWMPTFRKGGGFKRNDSTVELPLGIPLVTDEDVYLQLNAYLQKHDALMIIKIHPMQDPDTLTKLKDQSNIRILTGETVKKLKIDNYRLIKSADALISDYSSIAFQYLLLNRPLGFVLSDVKEYKLGFPVENPEDYLVGNKIYTYEDFIAFLEQTLRGEDPFLEKRSQLIPWLYKYRDGRSCQRLAEFMELKH